MTRLRYWTELGCALILMWAALAAVRVLYGEFDE